MIFLDGHGDQTGDNTLNEEGKVDEADGKDEYIVTTDESELRFSELVTDDVMFNLMVKPLHENVTLTAVFDCCSSGSILDLEYCEQNGQIVPTEDLLFRQKMKRKGRKVGNRKAKANVVCLSACLDKQEAMEDERYGGDLSSVFQAFLREFPESTYQDLLKRIRKKMEKEGLKQKTMLSVSKKNFRLSKKFLL